MKKVNRLMVLTLTPVLIVACATVSVPTDTDVKMPDSFTCLPSGIGEQNNLTEWWDNWHDPVLTRLIHNVLNKNYSIKEAKEKLDQAAYEAKRAGADLGPSAYIGSVAGAGYQHNENPIGKGSFENKPYGASVLGDISWEIDVFGQKKSITEAYKYRAFSFQDQVYITRMEVAAQTADYYFQILSLQDKKEILLKNIANYKEMERYARGMFKAGNVDEYEVNKVHSMITDAEAKLPKIDAGINSYIRSIAVLSGEIPQQFALSDLPKKLPQTVPALPSGINPAALLVRRPDILAKTNEIKSKAASVASAKADLYPRFNINFLSDLGHIDLDIDKTDGINGFNNMLSAGVSLPVFTNGRIRANIEAASADLRSSLKEYDNLLLKALAETDSSYEKCTALDSEGKLLKQHQQELTKMIASADQIFKYGNSTYDRVLTARGEEIASEAKTVENKLDQHLCRINLYKSLGGGWKEEQTDSLSVKK